MIVRIVILCAIGLLFACGGGGASDVASPKPPPPEPVAREQDQRSFAVPIEPTLEALTDTTVESDRWVGTIDGAAYRIEVPKQWNGSLVMWARGYWIGPTLYIENPFIRRHLIENGYAWAASSYTKNYYDVNAAIEDTNKLAKQFDLISASHGRVLSVPRRVYIAGWSMGGHVAAAAIESETYENARNKVHYDGALAMCGSMDDLEWFNYISAYQLALQKLLGFPAEAYPSQAFLQNKTTMQNILNDSVKRQDLSLPEIKKLYALLENLSGGRRPFYREGWFDISHQSTVFSLMNMRPNMEGVLARDGLDTRGVIYDFSAAMDSDAELISFNQTIFRVSPAVNSNPVQEQGLRWIPVNAGNLKAPVVSLHTLGDLTVPVQSQVRYSQRVASKGRSDLLTQRLIRDVGHCSFTVAEAIAAFDDLVAWSDGGLRPDGDNLLNASAISDPTAGCAHTDNRVGLEDRADSLMRARYQASYVACPK